MGVTHSQNSLTPCPVVHVHMPVIRPDKQVERVMDKYLNILSMTHDPINSFPSLENLIEKAQKVRPSLTGWRSREKCLSPWTLAMLMNGDQVE